MSSIFYIAIPIGSSSVLFALYEYTRSRMDSIQSGRDAVNLLQSLKVESVDEMLEALHGQLLATPEDVGRIEQLLENVDDKCGIEAFALTVIYSVIRYDESFVIA